MIPEELAVDHTSHLEKLMRDRSRVHLQAITDSIDFFLRRFRKTLKPLKSWPREVKERSESENTHKVTRKIPKGTKEAVFALQNGKCRCIMKANI